MKVKLDTVKIEMSYDDSKKLREELVGMIDELSNTTQSLAGYFNEAGFRESFPKINELLNILDIRNELPF